MDVVLGQLGLSSYHLLANRTRFNCYRAVPKPL